MHLLKRDQRGAAAVEFALLLLPLMTMVIGSLEIGYRLYAKSVANGALQTAARLASTGGYTGTQIDQIVEGRIREFRDDAALVITKKSYSDFTGVGLPEPLTSGSIESGTYCYQDINGNGSWDADQGTSGLGGAEDVIYYEVALSYPTLFPLSIGSFGLPQTMTIEQNTIVSNEPFAAKTTSTPSTECV